MKVKDNRLERTVHEWVGHLKRYDGDVMRKLAHEDVKRPDEWKWLEHAADHIEERLDADRTTRRAFSTNPRGEHCIMAVHVLLRDIVHVIVWMRSSDADKRLHDISVLSRFGLDVASRFDYEDAELIVFSSSFHYEVDE